MKTVKLVVQDEEDETVEHRIELSFEEAEVEKLRLFMRNFERFKDADLIQKGIPELKKMGWDTKQGQGLTFEFTDFDYKVCTSYCTLLVRSFSRKNRPRLSEPAAFLAKGVKEPY